MADTYIDPSMIPQFNLPNYYRGPQNSNGGVQNNNGGGNDLLNAGLGFLAGGPIGAAIGGGFGNDIADFFGFGSDKPSWQPYTANGMRYPWNPNSRNPIPLANVPGAPINGGAHYAPTAANVQTIYDLLPYLNQAANNTLTPTAVAQLQASQATAPGYAQLMTQLYNQYGPALNQIGNQIQQQNALAQAGTTNTILGGPGQQTVNLADQLQRSIDPQYYAARQQAGQRLGDLLNSIDLSGNLSGSEMNQIGQGLARQNALNGTLNAPSQSQTVANAMQYGQAGYQRKQQAISNLSQALNNASSFMPQARSMDAFQVATGRSSQPNPGQSNLGNNMFGGINQAAGSNTGAYGLAGQMFGGLNSLTAQTMAQDFQRNQNGFGTQFMSSFGNSMGKLPSGILGGMMGMMG